MRIKGLIEKDKEYLASGENPPKGVPVHTGPHQGKFYNTEEMTKTPSAVDETIKVLANKFKDAGFKLYEVGGSIRDSILGRKSSDADFTTDATPDKTKAILTDSKLGSVFGIGEAFGTVGLHTPDGEKIEITTFRKEVYPTNSRKPVVEFGKDLKDDLARRDFTFNALAKDALTGELIDPFGGQEDLKNGIIRTVGNSKDRFAEDPLRMLRAVRFACKFGFDKLEFEMPEPEKLQNISKERISEELNKILLSNNPKYGVNLLKKFGLMKYVIPEVEELYDVGQNEHHYTDVFNHTIDVVDKCSKYDYQGEDKKVFMLSAILHDIGKPKSKTGEGKYSHFYHHQDIGGELARKILTDLRYDNTTIDRVSKIVANHMRPHLSEPSPRVVNRMVRDLGDKDTKMVIDFSEADAASSNRPRADVVAKFREILQNTSLPADKIASPISGDEIINKFGVAAGKPIGMVKKFLTDAVESGELKPDDKETAYQMAEKFIEEKGLKKSIKKSKIYVHGGGDIPKGRQIYMGKRGRLFYETESQGQEQTAQAPEGNDMVKSESGKMFVDGIIKKGIPPGMRQAKPGEKPDWMGPRGGKYKKIRQNETQAPKPIESGAAESEIKEYKTFGKDLTGFCNNLYNKWEQDLKNYLKKDISDEIKDRVKDGVNIFGLIKKQLEKPQQDGGKSLFISTEGGKVHGFAFTKPHDSKSIEIQYLSTSPSVIAEREKKGVGTNLIYKIVKQAKESGSERVVLRPLWAAVPYYEKIGFKDQDGFMGLSGKQMDKFILSYENKSKVTKAEGFMPYEFGEYDMAGVFKLEDLHGVLVANPVGFRGGAGNKGINPDFRMYSNVKPSSSDYNKIPYEKVGELGNITSPSRKTGIIESAKKEKISNNKEGGKMPKVKGIIDKCIHDKIEVDVKKLDMPKLGVGMGANVVAQPIVGKINEAYDKTFNAQKSKDKLKEEVDVKKVIPALAIAGGKALGTSVGLGAANKVVGEGLSEGWNAAAGRAPAPPTAKSMDKYEELFPGEEIEVGMKEEMEHSDLTNGDPELTRKIVDAHLREDPHYYSKLMKVGLIKKAGDPVGAAVGAANNQAMAQANTQIANPGRSNSPTPMNKSEEIATINPDSFDDEFYKAERPPFDADDEREYYAEFAEPREGKFGREEEKELIHHNDKEIKNNNETQNLSIDQKMDDPKEIKQRLLGNIQHFLEKYEEDNTMNKKEKNQLSNIKKAIEVLNIKKEQKKDSESTILDINTFLKGYESLAYLGNDLGDERLFDIFTKAVQVNEDKNLNIKMNSEDRIAKIIAIDGVAHALHINKNQDGSSQYKVLDDLASVSKNLGEKERDTRLIIINNPTAAKDIEKLLKIEILQKSGVERSSKFWKLLEKAIKIGVKGLNNFELVALREFLYAKM